MRRCAHPPAMQSAASELDTDAGPIHRRSCKCGASIQWPQPNADATGPHVFFASPSTPGVEVLERAFANAEAARV